MIGNMIGNIWGITGILWRIKEKFRKNFAANKKVSNFAAVKYPRYRNTACREVLLDSYSVSDEMNVSKI